jgi:hypothetical protein
MRRSQFELQALAEVLPLSLVRSSLLEAGKADRRVRKLPLDLVAWLLVGMGLFRGLSIEAVLQRVVTALGGVATWGMAECPHATSIARARDRLGNAIATIFRNLADLLVRESAALDMWRGFRVLVMDGTTFKTPDTRANRSAFGKPGVSRGGSSGFPQMRALLLVGVWTHVVVDAVWSPYREGELRLAERLLDRLKPGTLLLLDRAFHCFVWPARFFEHQVPWVMRAKSGQCVATPKKVRRLGPGDWLCTLQGNATTRRTWAHLPQRVPLRMITRRRKGFRPTTILTSLVCETTYPADDVFALYQDRWEAELAYRELKVYLVDEAVPFRSHTPARVEQELYGLLIAYNCTRALMCRAATVAGVRPVALSFTECLEHLRLAVMLRTDQDGLIDAMSRSLLTTRRIGRSCPRAVKVKFSKWPRKRSGLVAKTRRQHQRARYEERRARLAAVR